MRVDGKVAAPSVSEMKLVKVTVAPGRNVYVGDPPVRWEGEGSNRRSVEGDQRVAEPGDVIELPEHEAKFMLSRGFVLDPDGDVVVPNGVGPDYDRDLSQTDNPAGIGMQNRIVIQGPDFGRHGRH